MSFRALDRFEVERLAVYNAEVSRGLVHVDEYREEMAELQRRFNGPGGIEGAERLIVSRVPRTKSVVILVRDAIAQNAKRNG